MQVVPLSQSFCRLILAIFHPFVTTIARFENRDASIASESVQSFMHLLTSPPTIRTLKSYRTSLQHGSRNHQRSGTSPHGMSPDV